ncbi:MAG: bifunctional folylpolyglutamate synthase/dihydrofolate synthase [Bacteroidaceae bacterium]|jgi:dihydrofolate synthase/folylpolyglutamate synthase|nr:bifunctional folylpolyglutamate synthase/dihydrofolate synthase [Bacteroidaceae bacterium]MBQ7484961.1 bifunctional folylpolyglutamate synthase/dihydrofolate synthase [Bacteroidaceae bacterium]
MDYKETIEYLFNSAPLFQNIGAGAYKEGLYNTKVLDEHFAHPHLSFKTIHVAGTNGKGSCSHTIASVLQEAGYKVGLYTSPHLVDFRERIRVNGKPISEQYVIDFVEHERAFFEPLHPSFFELTTAMAFKFFADEKVDVAVIEVGLGGRLDCTNIITPDVSIITNISFDHVQFLGDTLAKIASEKAGIIKPNIPVVIGETTPETKPVFISKAEEQNAPIIFAEEQDEVMGECLLAKGGFDYQTKTFGLITAELGGLCQTKNTRTIIEALKQLIGKGYRITRQNVADGFASVCKNTGLMGRWQKLSDKPKVICDTGHNVGGIQYIVKQLELQEYDNLRIVMGMVNDKDISTVLSMMPKHAVYYFTQASVKRAMPCRDFKAKAAGYGLEGDAYPTVRQAYEAALHDASQNDLVFVGGSSFIVADLLSFVK